MTIFHDFLGNAVKVGDKIVYPGRQGSHMWLNEGVVTKLNETKLTLKNGHTIHRVDRVVVVGHETPPYYKCKVCTLNNCASARVEDREYYY